VIKQTHIRNGLSNVSPNEWISLNVQRACVAFLITRRECRTLRSRVGFFGVFLVSVVIATAVAIYMVIHNLGCFVVLNVRLSKWNEFFLADFVVIANNRVLNAIHPMRNVLGETTAVCVHSALVLVRIIDMLVLVYHRVEAIFDEAVIGEVVTRLFDEVQVFGCCDAPMEDAITNRAMYKAVFLPEDSAFVDVARVYESFAVFAILCVMNLQMKKEFVIAAL